jgi:hypothetical protein
MMRDTQRSKVYAWERKYVFPAFEHASLHLEECVDLIGELSKTYRINSPAVADGRGTRNAYGSRDRISLPRHLRTFPVVLHEFAHAFCAIFEVCDRHGPVFVRTYTELLARHAHFKKGYLRDSLRAANVKVAAAYRFDELLAAHFAVEDAYVAVEAANRRGGARRDRALLEYRNAFERRSLAGRALASTKKATTRRSTLRRKTNDPN